MVAAPPEPSIKILSPELVARIAAGEVVERPASVLKELVENALDAGASRISAEIDSGGTACVRVSDDGRGMSPEDLPLAVQPHATSKLQDADQLHALETLGFRGEALPSIASVARFAIVSRRRNSETETRRPGDKETSGPNGFLSLSPCLPVSLSSHAAFAGDSPDSSDPGDAIAWRIDVHGGRPEVPDVRPAAGPYGTTVEARDLFYNLPARRKFLKGLAAEAAACADTFLRLALTRPDVAFILRQGRSELMNLPGVRGQGSGVRGQESGVRGQESGVRGQGSGVGSQESWGSGQETRTSAHAAPLLPASAYVRRAREALGRSLAEGLVALDFSDRSEQSPSALAPDAPGDPPYRLYGLLSPPAVTRPNRNAIYLTVNGRAVKDRTLTSALLEAFRHLLPPRRYPAAVLYLDIPGCDVDINVHPAKSEVRFRAPSRIYALFYHAVRSACGLNGPGQLSRPDAQAVHGGTPVIRQGDRETGRQGDTETGSHGDVRPAAQLKFSAAGPLLAPSLSNRTDPADPADPAEADAPYGESFPAQFDLWPRTASRTVFPDTVQEAPPRVYGFPPMPSDPSVPMSRTFPERSGQPFPSFSAQPFLATQPGDASPPVIVAPPAADYRIIGQAAGSYIVVEDESGVRFIDQHALHERILFERLLSAAQAGARGDAQGLLVPETLELSAAQAALVGADSEPLALLAHLGFDCEPFGPRALLVRAVPAVLKKAAPARLVSELLEALAAGDDAASGGPKAVKRWTLREKAAYILSCKAALKAGERLTADQMDALVAEFQAVAGNFSAAALTCPHGRPLALEVSWHDLERAVGRA